MLVHILQYILVMICFTLFLFLIHEIFRKYLKLTNAFFILVLFTFPLWFNHLEGWFLWVKTLLMVISIIIINFTRLSYSLKSHKLSFLKTNLPFWMIYSVLIMNILVALTPDIEIGNYYNAIAGLILCILVPIPSKGWRIDISRNKKHDLLVELPILWCLLYISWWMNLVYDVWPNIFSRGICLMAVTVIPIIMYKRSDLWLSIRAYTLALYMLSISFFDYSIPVIDSTIRPNNNVKLMWGVLNLSFHIIYSIWWFRSGKKRYFVKNNQSSH
jgi:hypothetical protein